MRITSGWGRLVVGRAQRAFLGASIAIAASASAGEFVTHRDGITDEVTFEQFATTTAEALSNKGYFVVLQSLHPLGHASTIKVLVGPVDHQCDGRYVRIRGNEVGWAASIPRESPRPDACMLSVEVAQIAGAKELRVEVPLANGEARVARIDIGALHDGSIRRLCVRGEPKAVLEKICSSFSYADLVERPDVRK